MYFLNNSLLFFIYNLKTTSNKVEKFNTGIEIGFLISKGIVVLSGKSFENELRKSSKENSISFSKFVKGFLSSFNK